MPSNALFTRNTSSHMFIDYCKDRGVDVWPIAERLNLKLEFYTAIAREANDPYFGINWALAQPDDFRHSGPLVHLAGQVTSWHGFVEIGLEYMKTFTNGTAYKMQKTENGNQFRLEITVHPLAKPCRQLLEHQLATIAQMALRAIPDFRFDLVAFQHDGNSNDPIYQKAFGRAVKFNAGSNVILWNKAYLDRNTLDASPLIKRGLKAYVKFQSRHSRKSRNNMSVAVSGLIPDLLGVQSTNLGAVSDILQISPKKLQRLLSEEQTSFSAILDETRKSLAVRYLLEMDMTLSQIARLLDYSSQETFIQAFHRWFDQTPAEFKAQARQNEG